MTFKNAQDRKTVVQGIPLERILLETDAPYLTPHPPGKADEPSYIPLIAAEIARLQEISLEEVAGPPPQMPNTYFIGSGFLIENRHGSQ